MSFSTDHIGANALRREGEVGWEEGEREEGK